ncbi:MAG: transcription antitermination factor NusB [Candidatus Babeliales bacterium]
MKKLTNNADVPNLTPIDAELNEQQQQAPVEEDFGPWSPEFSLNTRREERQLAFSILYALDRAEYSVTLDDIVHSFEKGFDLKIPKKSFVLTLVRGVLEHAQKLDEDLKPYLKNWRLERLGCCTHLALRLALWELQQPEAIPSIIINEAVELAKTFAEKDAYRFVNGILDEIAKSTEKRDDATPTAAPENETKDEK